MNINNSIMKKNKKDDFINCITLLNKDRVLVQSKDYSNTIRFIPKNLVFKKRPSTIKSPDLLQQRSLLVFCSF